METWNISCKIIHALNNTDCGQGTGVSPESIVKKILDEEMASPAKGVEINDKHTKCLFCGQEMEDEEKLVDFHVCPPDIHVSLNSVQVAMNDIFEKEEDGWTAWAKLFDWLEGERHLVSEVEYRKRYKDRLIGHWGMNEDLAKEVADAAEFDHSDTDAESHADDCATYMKEEK